MAADRPEATPVRGRDSARWCDVCNAYGDHHTDRHPGATPVPDRHAEGIEAAARAMNPAYDAATHDATRAQWRARAAEGIDAYLSATALVELGAVVEALRGLSADECIDLLDGVFIGDTGKAFAIHLLARFGSGEGTDHDD